MLVTILPFFLAANVVIDDDPRHLSNWNLYGGECTYDAIINMTLSDVVRPNDTFCSTVAVELKCRPKDSDSLSCRLRHPMITRPMPSEFGCSKSENFVPVGERFFDREPFEVRFNRRGIENLVVRRSIPRWRLDVIKLIVNQLQIGFEVDDRRERFTAMENSTVGYCEVEVKLTRDSMGNGERARNEGRDFEIVIEPARQNVRSLGEEKLVIEKVRRPKKCPMRAVYFFGNHEDYSDGKKGVFIDMTSSTSHTTISKAAFHSYTESKGVMKVPEKSATMYPYQHISLTLKRIDPAQDVLPTISSPASTSLYAYSDVDRIYRNS